MAKRKRTATKKVQAEDKRPFSLPNIEAKPDIDSDAFGNDNLTIRQRSFVAAITGPAGGNATKAAEIAGYASDNNNALRITACRLLAKANIQEAIAHAYAQRRMTPEWAKSQLVDLASGSMANFVSVDDDGKLVVEWEKAAAAGALGQIKEYVAPVENDGVLVTPGKIKLHDRIGALNTLLKIHGLLIERKDITSNGKTVKAFIDVDDGETSASDD